VRAVHQDVDGEFYVAVTVDDDPASDLHEWYGRSLFFYPDEIAVTARALVAGVGNIFFTDDGFGPEVARRLAGDPPDDAKIVDFGVRGLHLAYELLEGYERAILIDVLTRGEAPGTLYVVEPDLDVRAAQPDAHKMDVTSVFAFLRTLGGTPPPIHIVGCEPEDVGDGLGLTPAVAAAVGPAAKLVRRLLAQATAEDALAERKETV